MIERLDFIALDFETANQDRSSICEAGICVVKDGKIVETRSWLIRPEGNIYSWFNVHIHGIQPADTANAPSFPEIWECELRPRFDEIPVLVAHNAVFDSSCLRLSMERYGIKVPPLRVFCSCRAARHLYDFPSNSLENLCREFDIDCENHHRAGADALMCAKLFLRESRDAGWASLDEMTWCEGQLLSGNAVDYSPDCGTLCEEHVFYGTPTTLGELMKEGLFRTGMTQVALAEKVGTSQSRISEYVRGVVVPSLPVAAKICRELKIDANEFVRICSEM